MPGPFRVLEIRRGNRADLPVLADGELGFCEDTNELFIGSQSGNVTPQFTYTPANSAHWAGSPPADLLQAIQRLEAAVFLLGGTIA